MFISRDERWRLWSEISYLRREVEELKRLLVSRPFPAPIDHEKLRKEGYLK